MVTENIYKLPQGHYVCELIDSENPYQSCTAIGKDDIEAKMNAWVTRKGIITEQMRINPTFALVRESN